jgi:Asp-tRNA(Asn)/Glu-tRNA(Gln) amidotransferase A subunit family amidase
MSQETVANFEILRALSHERTIHLGQLSETLKKRLVMAENITHEQFQASQAHLMRCRRLFQDLMDDYDCILAPSAAGEAPAGLSSTGDPVFQKIWHGLNLPAINVPALQGENGLPVGVQIIGRPWSDSTILHHSEWIRCALDL